MPRLRLPRPPAAVLCAAGLLAAGCQRAAGPAPAGGGQSAGAKTGGAAQAAPIEPGPGVQKRLQTALIAARPGAVIELAAGRFELTGSLSLDVPGVTLRGQGMDKTILDFKQQEPGTGGEGLLVTQGDFTIEDLAIEDAKGDGLKVRSAERVTMRRVRAEWTGGPLATNGAYGLYPVECKKVLIEDCVARHAADAGIYVGQAEGAVVRRNRAEGNVAGIEIENTIGADVYENQAHGNAGGILVFALPNLPHKVGRGVRVFDNDIVENNGANFAPAGQIVAQVPSGTGLMIMACDQVEVYGNRISGNQSINLSVVSFLITELKFNDPEYDPFTEGVHVHDNRFSGGGERPQGKLGTVLGLLVGGKFPAIVTDGVVDEKKLDDGKLPEELSLRIHDNGPADFVNLDLAHFDPAGVLTGKLPNVTRDLGPYAGALPPLPAVTWEGLK